MYVLICSPTLAILVDPQSTHTGSSERQLISTISVHTHVALSAERVRRGCGTTIGLPQRQGGCDGTRRTEVQPRGTVGHEVEAVAIVVVYSGAGVIFKRIPSLSGLVDSSSKEPVCDGLGVEHTLTCFNTTGL